MSLEYHHARNLVLGGGAVGTATAYHLARRGEPVTLVEQFRIGHDRGSSHGAGRIARHSYADPRYARRMLDAFRAWRDFEADAGQAVYLRTGGVSVCPPRVDYVARVAASLAEIGVPHRRMTGAELRRTIPTFEVPADHDVVFEPDAGLLAASKVVALQVELARRHGGGATRVLEGCPIRRIDLDADRPTLLADGLRLTADRLIVAAGPWIGRLFPDLSAQLRPTRQQVCYFDPIDPAPFRIGAFPIFIAMGEDPRDAFYGMPEHLGAGVKVARHGGPEVDPDAVDRTIVVEEVEAVRRFLLGHVPALAGAPLGRAEVCLYTEAPDDTFRVGPRRGRPDLIVASPCSGHGFKFSNLVGRVVADLAAGGRSDLEGGGWLVDPSGA